MQKIVVIGSGGSGKPVLSHSLGEITQIPVYHLDALYWNPGWKPTPGEEWENLQRDLVKRDEWIIDGMYTKSLNIRLSACDTIILFDFPSWLTTYRVIKRGILYHGRTRHDLTEGCPEQLTWEFIKFVWTFRKNKRPSVMDKLSKFPGKNVITLRTPRDVNDLIKRVRTEFRLPASEMPS